ncbi:MAG TPA: FHA domain-containing protein [Microbacteriaceae bacterium]|nr:FHA domain-containing protein [Microbacteriaceae bacterium]
MSQLTLLVLQLAFLALLWFFIFAVVYALRSDLFGQRVRRVANPPGPPVETPPVLPGAEAVAPIPATAESARRLTITGGPKVGAEIPLSGDEITIGRSPESSLILRDDITSTRHARLSLWNGQWMLQDLDSTNGTFLAGVRVSAPAPVSLNTPITIGATTFELRR